MLQKLSDFTALPVPSYLFLKLEFILCKASQALKDIKLEEKEDKDKKHIIKLIR